MPPTNFALDADGFITTAAGPRSVGGGSLAVRSAAGLAAPTGSQFYRLTVARGASPSAATIITHLKVTGVSGNTLTVSGTIDGYADAAVLVDDYVWIACTKGTLGDIQGAVNALETSIAGSTVAGNIPGDAASITGSITESQVTGLTADLAAKLAAASNLSDLASAATARTNLGLGTAAVDAATAFVSSTATQAANSILAGPATGAAAAPTFRALTAADLPAGGGGSPGGSSGQLQFNNAGAFGGAAAVVYAASGHLLTVTALAATDTPATVKGVTSQSGNLQEWQDSTGAKVAAVGPARTSPLTLYGANNGEGLTLDNGAGVTGRFGMYAGALLFSASTGMSVSAGSSANGQAILLQDAFAAATYALGYIGDGWLVSHGRVAYINQTGTSAYVGFSDNVNEATVGSGTHTHTRWQTAGSTVASLSSGGALTLGSMADSAAPNLSLYFSTTGGKLAFKDSGGTVHLLY